MNLNEWLETNRPKFGSDYEILFAENVLPLVAALSLDSIAVQYPFQDMDKKQRYCDFVILENDDVRIAIEIDGYDKRGTGMGMSHSEFIDWQRRQSALTSQGWYVLRFANTDVRDNPQHCAEHISLLLKRSRSNRSNKELSAEEKKRLDALTKAQVEAIGQLIKDNAAIKYTVASFKETIEHLIKDTSVMKYTVASFTALIFGLVMLIVWQSERFRPVAAPSALPTPQSAMPSPTKPAEQGFAGCLIKGNISSSGEKIYHLPGCGWYEKTKIDRGHGERWFCSETDAQTAGWRKALNCN